MDKLRSLLNLPLFESVSPANVDILQQVAEASLHASLFIGSALYDVEQKDEVFNDDGKPTSGESYCRKYAWRICECSVSSLSLSHRL